MIECSDNEAVYVFGEWIGMETLEPGKGYLYFSNSDQVKTLTFKIGRKKKAE